MNLINQSIDQKRFPKLTKLSKILPKWKNKIDCTNPKNLRPINIISVFSKVNEKAILSQIVRHLLNNNLIPHNSQGAVKGRSSVITVISLHEQLSQLRSINKTAALVTSDQSAAFDLLNHNILCKKLNHVGIKFTSTDMIMIFLQGRSQLTEVNTHRSKDRGGIRRT